MPDWREWITIDLGALIIWLGWYLSERIETGYILQYWRNTINWTFIVLIILWIIYLNANVYVSFFMLDYVPLIITFFTCFWLGWLISDIINLNFSFPRIRNFIYSVKETGMKSHLISYVKNREARKELKTKFKEFKEAIKKIHKIRHDKKLSRVKLSALVHLIKKNSTKGLRVFVLSWITSENIKHILRMLDNLDALLENSKKILSFMHAKATIPDKDEAWGMDISIDMMDNVLELINVKIHDEIISFMTLAERRYYNDLSKKLILSTEAFDELNLEELTTEMNFALIDAKIITQYVNDMVNISDVEKEVGKYLELTKLSMERISQLNFWATKIMRSEEFDQQNLNLLSIARYLEIGLLDALEVLYFYNNADIITKTEFSEEDIDALNDILIKALKECRSQKMELNVMSLVSDLNLELTEANEVIALYEANFPLPRRYTRGQLDRFDKISYNVVKYIKEVKEDPSIDDLMLDLNLNIKEANQIYQFMKEVTAKPFNEDFNKYPESILTNIDSFCCSILDAKIKGDLPDDIVSLSYQFETGVYSIKRALAYIEWIEKLINDRYIRNLRPVERETLEKKIRVAFSFVKENGLKLDFNTLIQEAGFNLKTTYLIIGLYNSIISKRVEIEAFTEEKKRKIEALAREVYNLKKEGKIESYDAEEVFALDFGNITLQEQWEALNYLKAKVLNVLMEDLTRVETSLGKITTTNTLQLNERHDTEVGKTEKAKLTKEKIKIKDSTVKFKKAAENVSIKRGIDFVGGLIRYKVALENNTEMLINNVEVSLQMTAEHIRIIDIKPQVYKKGDRAKIPNMSPIQSESIDFYLEPMICGNIPVSPIATYIDAFGKTQFLTREPINVVSKCPPIINPGEENIAKVKKIYESDEIIRSFRSFELQQDPQAIFNLLIDGISMWAGKYVSKPLIESEVPFTSEAFYYVLNQNKDRSLGHKEQIIIKVRVVEENNIAMIHIGAEKNATVNGILTHVWQLANARVGETFGYKFDSLRCPQCGASIEKMDKDKEVIKCIYCDEVLEKKVLK